MYHHVSLRFLLTLTFILTSSFEAAPLRAASAAPVVNSSYQVKDINSGSDTTTELQLNFKNMAALGTTVFFSACPAQRCGLWKSDAASMTAVQVAALDAENKTAPSNITVVGGKIFFTSIGGGGLWRSDGTTQGTLKLTDVFLFDQYPSSFPARSFMATVNGTLFFLTPSNELWKSDGSVAGTVRIKAIQPPTTSTSALASLTVVGSALFVKNSAADGVELWRSDGTENGTKRVQTFTNVFDPMVALGSTLFFVVANETTNTKQLWKSDGTQAGTKLALSDFDIDPTYLFSNRSTLTSLNGTLYFQASNNGLSGLWKSNGTQAGTQIVAYTEGTNPIELTRTNNLLFFCTYGDSGKCNSLWRSDSTEQGTYEVKTLDIYAPQWDNYTALNTAPALVSLNNNVFFSAREGLDNYDLWKSDGTEKGTVLIKHLVPQTPYPIDGINNGLLSFIVNVGGTLFFDVEQQDSYGKSHSTLWKSDGTAAGTKQIKATLPKPGNSRPAGMTSIGNTLYFSADDGVSGRELWKSDGTASGTTRVKDIRPGEDSALNEYTQFVALQNTVYFFANDGVSGSELWRSDGTENGTKRVKDINPAASTYLSDYDIVFLTVFNGAVYFAADDGTSGRELWKSDGTDKGTVRVKDINPGASDAFNDAYMRFASLNGALYFSATDGASGIELWKTDGTEKGTVRVKDINVGISSASPYWLTTVGTTLFFVADDGVHGSELWKSDGTATGTLLVKDFTPGTCTVNQQSTPCATNISAILRINGVLFFLWSASATTSPSELWRSDGTPAGTKLVKQMPQNSLNYQFTSTGNTLLFSIDTGTTAELWRSDGTTAGTSMINRLTAGHYSTIVPTTTTLCFIITNTAATRELWCGDGSSAGSTKLQTFTTTTQDTLLDQMVSTKSRVFFTEDNRTGVELWAIGSQGAATQARVFLPLAVR